MMHGEWNSKKYLFVTDIPQTVNNVWALHVTHCFKAITRIRHANWHPCKWCDSEEYLQKFQISTFANRSSVEISHFIKEWSGRKLTGFFKYNFQIHAMNNTKITIDNVMTDDNSASIQVTAWCRQLGNTFDAWLRHKGPLSLTRISYASMDK